MNGMPIIVNLSIENLGEQMKIVFAERTEDYKEYVNRSIDKLISEEFIQNRIDAEVRILVDKAISNSINSYEMQMAVTAIIRKSLWKETTEEEDE